MGSDTFQQNLDILLQVSRDWGSGHPLFVHFPIAIFTVVPLFILLGLILTKWRPAYYTTAMVLLAIGWLTLWMAFTSGEAASELVKPDPVIVKTLSRHLELAELARRLFAILTVLFAVIWGLPRLTSRKVNAQTQSILLAVYLLFYSYGVLIIFQTAHQGGKLVHDHGVMSLLYQPHTPLAQ